MTVIDVHAHILPQSAVRAYEQEREWFGTTITKTAEGKPGLQTGSYRMNLGAVEYWLPPRDRLPFMDEDRIDRQFLSLNPQLFRDHLDTEVAIDCTRAVNDEIAEAVNEFPNRFLGACGAAAAGHRRSLCANSIGQCPSSSFAVRLSARTSPAPTGTTRGCSRSWKRPRGSGPSSCSTRSITVFASRCRAITWSI